MTAITSRVRLVARHGLEVLLVAGLLCGSSPAMAQSSWRFAKVIAVGDSAPGPEGGTFALLLPPALNNKGDVALDGVTFPGGAFEEGVYLAGRGRPVAITRFGRLAPGGGVFGGFGLFGSIGLNDSGEVAFAFGRDPVPQPARPWQFGAGVYRRLEGETLKAVFVPHVTHAPGGTTFEGAGFHATMNEDGDVAFAGVVDTDKGNPGPMARDLGLGQGVFVGDRRGRITKVASPGDDAPGGGRFDYAEEPWINDKGDVAFGGHVKGEECVDVGGQGASYIFCGTSVYLREHDGKIRSIAHQGRPAPGGGTLRVAFGPVINNSGDILFGADLTPAPGAGDKLAIFLHRNGETVSVARPGDRMPGGGRLLRASYVPRNFDLNNDGDVVFDGALDTKTNGQHDNGVYLWSKGKVSLIARTGTAIHGLGVIRSLSPTIYGSLEFPIGYTAINDRGQVAFLADMFDGSNVVLLATPR